MELKVESSYQSPNFASEKITVEYAVIHYTACDLKKTLEIFMSPEKKVCAHFVINTDGTIFDLGKFLENKTFLMGAHAGKSKWTEKAKKIEALNRCSVGIELVNLNGNIFKYPKIQLEALYELLKCLQKLCPALKSAERIVGHEQIAGFRGKCDPGLLFPWIELFQEVFPGQAVPERRARLSTEDASKLEEYLSSLSQSQKQDPDFWAHLSSDLEKGLA